MKLAGEDAKGLDPGIGFIVVGFIPTASPPFALLKVITPSLLDVGEDKVKESSGYTTSVCGLVNGHVKLGKARDIVSVTGVLPSV
jgi:hypothetical protein